MDQRSDPERDGVVEGYAHARAELHALLTSSSVDELKARSSGTRWTNEQLLFHMVFGYMIVRALLPLVRMFSRLPPRVSRGFAGILNAVTRPFDVVNYWGSRWGARVFNRTRMEAQMDRTLRALIRSRDKETTVPEQAKSYARLFRCGTITARSMCSVSSCQRPGSGSTMGTEHSHGSAVSAAGRHRKPLFIAFALTATYALVELIVGFAVNSLALISDAAHMGTDVVGLGMALAAITLATRPASTQRTYGVYRLEVLAALANGILLFAVAGYVIFEAVQRFTDPPAIPGMPLLVVASVGLVINLISFRLLSAGSKESLNLKGASLEVLGDLIGSVGVIVAAIILYTTGWAYADPIIGVGIGLFILPRTWKLVRQTLRILMEVAPPDVNLDELQDQLSALPGVAAVHDLHVWTITSGMESASGHVVVEDGADYRIVLDSVLKLLQDEHHIEHVTIQCEPPEFRETITPF